MKYGIWSLSLEDYADPLARPTLRRANVGEAARLHFNRSDYAGARRWRERSRSFESIAAIRSWGGALTGQGEPEIIRGLRVSADYFKLLGVSPALGRDFRLEEDRPATRFVVVISHSLWQRRFNSDP